VKTGLGQERDAAGAKAHVAFAAFAAPFDYAQGRLKVVPCYKTAVHRLFQPMSLSKIDIHLRETPFRGHFVD
jgi:hypothetical protein